MTTKVEGIDYTPEGIEALRSDVIVYRNRALDAMPEGAEMAVVLSHVLALLAYLKELVILNAERMAEWAPAPPVRPVKELHSDGSIWVINESTGESVMVQPPHTKGAQ
jgi:hypothetical protein